MSLQMGLNVGVKGVHYLTGHLPSWLNYTEAEKMEWMNKVSTMFVCQSMETWAI